MLYEIIKSSIFNQWLERMRDRQAKKAVISRILRAEMGNFGDWKSVGGGVMEMRILIGKGHRIYFTVKNNQLILLLNGGDKSSQAKDIKLAKEILKNWEETT